MAIAVQCPNCGRAYNLSDKFAGKAVRCASCQTGFAVPAAQSAEVFAPAQYAVRTPIVGVEPAAPVLRPVRRKRKTSPMFLVAGLAGGGLLVVAAIAGLLLWGVYSTASSLVAVTNAPQPPAPQPPVVTTGRVQRAQVTPAFNGVMPGTPPVGNTPIEPSAAEAIVQRMIAKANELNGLLAQVVDGPSAERLRDQIVVGFGVYADLLRQLETAVRTISPQEDRRLEALYAAQFKSGVEQMKNHLARIRAQGRQWAFDDMHRRFDELHARSRGLAGGAPMPGFQPSQPAPFQPPQSQPSNFQPPHFQPPNIPHPSIPRPSGPHMRSPRHRFGR
ncbi:MAG TPA: hypothetical protein VF278_21585 [Pirellulales bacterium]